VNRPQRKHFHETDRKENTAAPFLPWDRPQRKRWSLPLLRGCWLLGNVLPLLTVVSQCARHNMLKTIPVDVIILVVVIIIIIITAIVIVSGSIYRLSAHFDFLTFVGHDLRTSHSRHGCNF
jgi:hypothetical protein